MIAKHILPFYSYKSSNNVGENVGFDKEIGIGAGHQQNII